MHLIDALRLSREAFEQNLNTGFVLRDPQGARATLDLVEVRNGSATPGYEVFTLLFRGDLSLIHPQRTYSLEHASMGAFDLFLVPVGRDQNGVMYEAVFNRTSNQQQS